MARPHKPLATRQREIVMCRCVHGLTNDETGKRLGISGDTVKNIVTTVFKKMEVASMNQVCFRLGRTLGPEEEPTS